MSGGDLLVEAREVRHTFGEGLLQKEVLHGVSCEIRRGEIVIVTGPSGSGKTTFLTLIGALRDVQSGSIRLHGRELRGASSRELVQARRSVGFIFQQHHLLPALSARENVQMPLVYDSSLSVAEIRARALQLLDAVGMAEHAHKKPAQLSGGQRQRVAIARALIGRPQIVLADEPTSSLDGVAGREVVQILERLARQEGCAVILVTHDSRILDVADRILHLEDGDLEESDLRFERLRASVVEMGANVAGYLAAVRPGEKQPPSLAERRRAFVSMRDTAQHDLLQLKQLGSVRSGAVLDSMQRLLGEIESLSEAVEKFASWYLGKEEMPEIGAGEFEAVEAMLQLLSEGLSQNEEEVLDLVSASTQRGNTFIERLLGRAMESTTLRAELLTLVTPVFYFVRSVAEKTRELNRHA